MGRGPNVAPADDVDDEPSVGAGQTPDTSARCADREGVGEKICRETHEGLGEPFALVVATRPAARAGDGVSAGRVARDVVPGGDYRLVVPGLTTWAVTLLIMFGPRWSVWSVMLGGLLACAVALLAVARRWVTWAAVSLAAAALGMFAAEEQPEAAAAACTSASAMRITHNVFRLRLSFLLIFFFAPFENIFF